ncbi:MAG TPA: SsrA-binding protein [Holosporales bacterium]|nr:SsrA-binding protein [Holosporales bacterium]
MAKKKRTEGYIAENRKARHDYTIEDSLEAGIMLLGSEVKSIRMQGGVSLVESHAGEKQGDLYLFNANIPEYKMSNQFNHEPRRPRKLLLKKREINKLSAAIKRQGIALIPLKMYFNKRGLVKLLLGIASGKKKTDKREADKQRDWQRQKERILKNS